MHVWGERGTEESEWRGGGAPCPRSLFFLLLRNGSACSIIQIRSPPKEGGPKKCAVENDSGVGMGDLSAPLFSPGANCGRAAEREGKEEVECCCFMSRPLSTHSRGRGRRRRPGMGGGGRQVLPSSSALR